MVSPTSDKLFPLSASFQLPRTCYSRALDALSTRMKARRRQACELCRARKSRCLPGISVDICKRKELRFVDVTSALQAANEHTFGDELLVALQVQTEASNKWPRLATLSYERCKSFCEHYQRLVNAVPFAIRPSSMAPRSLLSTSPILLLSIILSASSSFRELEMECEDVFRHVLAERAIVKGQRSLELLQSLLTYLIWYPHRFDPSTQQYFQFLQLALSMAADLGLYRKTFDMHTVEPEGLNPVRTSLLCYYLSCGSGILGFDRPDSMRCIEKLKAAAEVLARSSDRPLDQQAPAIIELMYIVAQQWDRLSHPDRARLELADSTTRLEAWKATHFRSTMSPAIKTSYHFISAYGIVKSTGRRSLPAHTIHACVEHLAALLSNVLDQDISYLFLLGAVEWGHVLTSLFLLPKLETSLPADSPQAKTAPVTFEYVARFRNLLGKIRNGTHANSTLNTPHFFGWIEKILSAVEKQTISRLQSSATEAGLNSEETAHELVNSFVDGEKHDGPGVNGQTRPTRGTTTEDFWTDFMSDWLHW